MSISDKITALTNARAAIRTALANKGITNAATAGFSSFASLISNITTGGSSSGEGFQLAKVTEFLDSMPTAITVAASSTSTDISSYFDGTYTVTNATANLTGYYRVYYCAQTNKYLHSNIKYAGTYTTPSWIIAPTIATNSSVVQYPPCLYTYKNNNNNPWNGTLAASSSTENGWSFKISSSSSGYATVTTTYISESDVVLKGVLATQADWTLNDFTFDTAEKAYTGYDQTPVVKNIYLVNPTANKLIGNAIMRDGYDYICTVSNVTYSDTYKGYAKLIEGPYSLSDETSYNYPVYYNKNGTGKLMYSTMGGYVYNYKSGTSWNQYYPGIISSSTSDLTNGNAYITTSASTYGTIETVKYAGKAVISPTITGCTSGQWSIDGGTTWHTTGETEVGFINVQYTISFKDVNGYTTPTSSSTRLTSSGWSPSGAYSKKVDATLTTTITGSTDGKWSVDNGTTWKSSGETVSGYYAGDSVTVTFSSVDGYITPDSQTVTLSGGSNTVTGAYESTEGKVKGLRFKNTTTTNTTFDGDYYPTTDTVTYNSTTCTVYKRADGTYYLSKFSGSSGWVIWNSFGYTATSDSKLMGNVFMYSSTSTCDAVTNPSAAQLNQMTWYIYYSATPVTGWSDIWGDDIWNSQGGSSGGGDSETGNGINITFSSDVAGLNSYLTDSYAGGDYTDTGTTTTFNSAAYPVYKNANGYYLVHFTSMNGWGVGSSATATMPSDSSICIYTTDASTNVTAPTAAIFSAATWYDVSSAQLSVGTDLTFTDIGGGSSS